MNRPLSLANSWSAQVNADVNNLLPGPLVVPPSFVAASTSKNLENISCI